jgi:hypothetical protein
MAAELEHVGHTPVTTATTGSHLEEAHMVDINHTLNLAKRNQIGKAELFSRMQTIAEAQRDPGESTAQSFVRFISTDEGAELFRIQKAMSGPDIAPQMPAPVAKSSGGGEWGDFIATMKKASPGVSEHRLINAALSTPEGLRLFQATKRNQQISCDTGFTKADMETLDAIAKEQNAWVDMRKGSPGVADTYVPSTYEALLDKVRAQYPYLSESKVHDYARAKDPAAWEDHKLNKLGGRQLPQSRHQREQAGDEHPTAAMSGRTQPSRAPQWRSDHSSSSPTTPERKPERMDDRPTIKMLNRLAHNAGMSRVELNKLLSGIEVGRKWLAMAAMER